jgi:hypothetical protein
MSPVLFLKYNFNIKIPSTSRSSKWCPSFRFRHQNRVSTSPYPCACYMPRPQFFLIESFEMITKFFIMQFPLDSCYLAPLRTEYSPQHPVLRQPQSMFFPQCKI